MRLIAGLLETCALYSEPVELYGKISCLNSAIKVLEML